MELRHEQVLKFTIREPIIFGQSTPPIDAWSVVIMSELYDGKTPEHSRADIGKVQASLSKRWGRWSWLYVCVYPKAISTILQKYFRSRVRGEKNGFSSVYPS